VVGVFLLGRSAAKADVAKRSAGTVRPIRVITLMILNPYFNNTNVMIQTFGGHAIKRGDHTSQISFYSFWNRIEAAM
jgi:hypothetical protein